MRAVLATLVLALPARAQQPVAPGASPAPVAPPGAWLSLIGAYVSASDPLYAYEDPGALTLLVKACPPARAERASESVP